MQLGDDLEGVPFEADEWVISPINVTPKPSFGGVDPMYGFAGGQTVQHVIGTKIEELAERCSQRGEAKLMTTVVLSNNTECVVAVYRPNPARKPDPSAP